MTVASGAVRAPAVAVLGASGYLGSGIVECLIRRGRDIAGTYATSSPVAPGRWHRYRLGDDPAAIAAALAGADAVIMAARLAGTAEDDEAAASFETRFAPLARALYAAVSPTLVYVSSDAVFSGQRGGFREDDEPRPTTAYGMRQRRAEEIVLGLGGETLVVRTSFLFGESGGRWDRRLTRLVERLETGEVVDADTNVRRSPVLVGAAAEAIVAAALARDRGVLHLAAPAASVHDLFLDGLRRMGKQALAVKVRSREATTASDTSLGTVRGRWLPGVGS
jgi:dTDP-4-dehydrorhamnose reductase